MRRDKGGESENQFSIHISNEWRGARKSLMGTRQSVEEPQHRDDTLVEAATT